MRKPDYLFREVCIKMLELMRILKWVLVLLLLTQLPFCYKVWQSHRLNRYLSSPVSTPDGQTSPYQDWRGAIHVHSASGGHSLGTYTDILAAARKWDYDYVFITEHVRERQALQPLKDPEVLLIYGWEKQLGEGLGVLTDPDGNLRLIADFEGESLPEGFDGVEIYNLHRNGQFADSWFNRVNFFYHRFAYSDLFYFQLLALDRERIGPLGELVGFWAFDSSFGKRCSPERGVDSSNSRRPRNCHGPNRSIPAQPGFCDDPPAGSEG